MKPYVPGAPLPGRESPSFLEQRGEQLYVVHHEAAGAPQAVVVLAGPMSLERSHSYLNWVRWSRTLALNGYDVWRFDYRGVGESTGDFRAQTFDTWKEDLELVVEKARASKRGRVIVLGLRLGALLGRTVFDAHQCDAFLAWEPPAGGKPMMMDMLRRKLAADYAEATGGEKKTRDDYVRDIEQGAAVEVEGFFWTQGLWKSGERYVFAEPERLEGEWFIVYLDGRGAERLPKPDFYASVRVPKPVFWLQSSWLVPDLTELFTVTLDALDGWAGAWAVVGTAALEAPKRESSEVQP